MENILETDAGRWKCQCNNKAVEGVTMLKGRKARGVEPGTDFHKRLQPPPIRLYFS
jgi:hypothetical protein